MIFEALCFCSGAFFLIIIYNFEKKHFVSIVLRGVDPLDKKMAKFILEHEKEVFHDWQVKLEKVSEVLPAISSRLQEEKTEKLFRLIITSFYGDTEEHEEKLTDFGAEIVRLGWPITFVTGSLRELHLVIYQAMLDSEEYTESEQNELIYSLENWFGPLSRKIVEAYSSSWESTVLLQKIALQELSAPLIPIFEKISIMPLIGTIDTERARHIMEHLLEGVVKNRSEVVLIDITGVPVVDTMVAHHIIQAADAVRLVGAKCMIVGIRPEIAQTIVNLGIDLSQIITTSTLQRGVRRALELTNRKIVQLEGEV